MRRKNFKLTNNDVNGEAITEDCNSFAVDFENSKYIESPVGKLAYIQKLKELSKKHVSDMEGRSSDTSRTEEETSPSEDNDGAQLKEAQFQGCSVLPDFISTLKNFDMRKYTKAFSSSLSMCSAKTYTPILETKHIDPRTKSRDVRVRDRRKEREDRVNEFNCSDIEIYDDVSISNFSGITMHTLQIQDFKTSLKAKKERERERKSDIRMEDKNKEMQRIRKFLIAEAGKREVYGNDMSFETAVYTLHNLSKKLGVPVKDLLHDRGLRDYLRQKDA